MNPEAMYLKALAEKDVRIAELEKKLTEATDTIIRYRETLYGTKALEEGLHEDQEGRQ